MVFYLKKTNIIIFCLVIFLFTILISNSASASEIKTETIKKEIFEDVVSSFELYTHFFSEVTYKDNVIISNIGYTENQAIEYLTKGFSYNLAYKIVSTYTVFDTSSSQLFILATEGIPIVTEQYIDLINYFFLDENNVILHIFFENPYGFNEDYSYFIFVKWEDNDKRWIVNGLFFYEY